MIYIKSNPNNKQLIKKNIYESSLQFTEVKKIYDKYFGNILSIDNIIYKEKPVFNEKIIYSQKNKYKDGVSLTVEKNYMVPSIESGIVVYIGEKKDYGNTIVIEQINGIDVFYSNIEIPNIKLYDYIEKGEYLGQTKTEKLYMVFQKDGEIINYDEYI